MSIQTAPSTFASASAVKDILFTPYRRGALALANRMVMAPMTRSRAIDGGIPHPATQNYYVQRASAGLIVTEGAQVSTQGVGYSRTPGIHTVEQAAAWKKVTDAVHRAGGKIFVQLFHGGRISHPDFHDGALPVAPSAIAAAGEVFTGQGMKPLVTPRALETSDIAGVVAQYRDAAQKAKEAGFDGVEIHGANGYLPDQFTRDGSNRRTDAYGGSVENRARFALEVAQAAIAVWGADRVGYRISPTGAFNSMSDSNPLATFSYLTERLNALRIGYLHVVDSVGDKNRVAPTLRNRFEQTFIINGGYDAQTAESALRNGEADLVSFGAAFLANPDLPLRYKLGAALNTPDRATFYAGEEKGYTDYPALGA